MMLTNWKKFWTEYPDSVEEHEFLAQVGHTLNGRPYTNSQFELMVASIRDSLQLTGNEILLDLCCGNGVVTVELAKHCRSVVGVDFSEPLVKIAQKYNGAGNLSYLAMDALLVGNQPGTLADAKFNRVVMYAALQHFQTDDLVKLLSGIRKVSHKSGTILLGGVLDVSRRQAFLDSPYKRIRYLFYRLIGRDRLGTWWNKDYIRSICKELAMSCEIDDSSSNKPGGHYRFDAKIIFNNSNSEREL